MNTRARVLLVVAVAVLLLFGSTAIAAALPNFIPYPSGELSGDLPHGAGDDNGDVWLWGSSDFRLSSGDVGVVSVSDATGDGWGQVSPYSGTITGNRYKHIAHTYLRGVDGTVKTTVLFAHQVFAVGNDQAKCWKIEAETPNGWYNGATTYEVRPKWDYTWYSGTSNETHSGAGSYPAGDSGIESAMVVLVADRRPATDVYYYRVYHTRISPGCFMIGYKGGSTTVWNGAGGAYVRLTDNMTAYAPNGGGAGAGLGASPLISSSAAGEFYAGYSDDAAVADAMIGTPPDWQEWGAQAQAGEFYSTVPIDKPGIDIDESMETSGVPTGFDAMNPVTWWDWLWGRLSALIEAMGDWFWFLDLFDTDAGGAWK